MPRSRSSPSLDGAEVLRGSFAIVEGLETWLSGASFTFVCRVFPTGLGGRRQALLARLEEDRQRGFALMLTNDGRLRGSMGSGDGFANVDTEKALSERCWHRVWMRFGRRDSRPSRGVLANGGRCRCLRRLRNRSPPVFHSASGIRRRQMDRC